MTKCIKHNGNDFFARVFINDDDNVPTDVPFEHPVYKFKYGSTPLLFTRVYHPDTASNFDNSNWIVTEPLSGKAVTTHPQPTREWAYKMLTYAFTPEKFAEILLRDNN